MHVRSTRDRDETDINHVATAKREITPYWAGFTDSLLINVSLTAIIILSSDSLALVVNARVRLDTACTSMLMGCCVRGARSLAQLFVEYGLLRI